MRPSHHLCSLVLSIPRSSATISHRPSHDSYSVSPSRKRSKSPAASVPLSSPISGALSYARANLLPSPKRIRSPESATVLEVSSVEGSESSRYMGTELVMIDDVLRCDGIDIDPENQQRLDECNLTAEALRDKGLMLEFHQEERAVEVTYETLGDLVQRFHDHTEEILVHRVQAIESVKKDQGHRIVATGQQSADMLERIRDLERDNRRLRDMIDVASQRVGQSQRRELRVQRETRQVWRFRFYDRKRIASLEAYTRRHLGYCS
ncbi:hypothetical protein Tco_0738867 [Tanacetum coccineum]